VANLSQATWIARAPNSTLSEALLMAATYASQTDALAAIVHAADTYLSAQGITPSGGALSGDVTGPSSANVVQKISGNTTDNLTDVEAIALQFGTTLYPNQGATRSIGFSTSNKNVGDGQLLSFAAQDASGAVGKYGGALVFNAGIGEGPGGDYTTDGYVQFQTSDGRPLMFVGRGLGSSSAGLITMGPLSRIELGADSFISGDHGAIRLGRSVDYSGVYASNAAGDADIRLIDIDVAGNTNTIMIGDANAAAVRMTAGANSLEFSVTTAATATAGGGVAIPATVAGFLNIKVNGTVRKIPFYAN
jgi:hypothetical protein